MDKDTRSSSSFQKQVKQPTTNWLELPSDVMANILYRIGVHDILENAQKVCIDWRKICKDPAMWRVICIDARSMVLDIHKVTAMCKHAVERSQGQLIDITILNFGDEELLLYVANRSSQLRCLRVAYCYGNMNGCWVEALKKFPLLEELSLYSTKISKEGIETIGRYCPILKTLKVNRVPPGFRRKSETVAEYFGGCHVIAIAIGENLPELEHLELIGNNFRNDGLEAILNGCRYLKSLNLRQCNCIDLKGEPDLWNRCLEQIKCLKLSIFSLQGFVVTNKLKLHLDDYGDNRSRCHEKFPYLPLPSRFPCF